MDKTKNKGGRPKEDIADKVDFHQIKTLAGFNHTEAEIALIIGVCERTFENYKKDERFVAALKKGKAYCNSRVIQSLYKRATGYSVKEVTYEAIKFDSQTLSVKPKAIKVKTVIKHIEPNTTAMIFWLKNRCEDWRDVRDNAPGNKPPADHAAKVDKLIADAEARAERAGETCH